MKKNGFVSMTLVYAFLIVFLFLMLAILDAYSEQNRYKSAIDEKINLNINTQYDYCEYSLGQTFIFNFKQSGAQAFTSKCNGKYKIELWGANGGVSSKPGAISGKGGYVSGEIILPKGTNLYVYVGEKGKYSGSCDATSFNANTSGVCVSGGGATDVRLLKGKNDLEWYGFKSLTSRIIVAGGGGGALNSGNAGDAGGFHGKSNSNSARGGAQVIKESSYSTSFGLTTIREGLENLSGGGGGFFAGESSNVKNGGGGSSYISGHTGCVAVIEEGSANPRKFNGSNCAYSTSELECSIHYSSLMFSKTLMLEGNDVSGTYSNPNSNGNGYARITFISEA